MTTPDPLTTAMADPAMRLAHLLWHGVRERWEGLSPADQAAFQTQYGPDWVPPHPSRDAAGKSIVGNGAGIDFLAMHRGMIEHAAGILGATAGTRLDGWPDPPPVGDTTYPVPRGYRLPEAQYQSKDDTNWGGMIAQTQALLAPANLGLLSLDELGSDLERGIHAGMHERFGDYGSNNMLRTREPDPFVAVDPQWNDATYDSLLDAYSAHVHPWFWKIHGWIDAQIGLWEAVTGNDADPLLVLGWSGMMPHHPGAMPMPMPDFERLRGAASFIGASGQSGMFRWRRE